MTTYDIVHLVLFAAGEVQGRTKLQKLVYFIAALSNLPGNLGFRAHYFGPYSPEVAGAVDDLRSLGFLEQRSSSWGIDPRGFELARYDYSLTDEGKQIAQEKTKKHPEEWKQIKRAVKTLRQANATDYVKLSIAAKAYFLFIEKTKQQRQTVTVNELAKLMPEFGWQVTHEQIKEAGKFLETVGLIKLRTAK